MIWTHSHNDYEQDRPLFDALLNRFRSVEADIWLDGDEIRVAHYGFVFVGSLRGLYLDPLQAMVDAFGSIYGDGQPLYLWIDLKSSEPLLRRHLREQLSRYSMLRGPRPMVIVVLTGDEGAKAAYLREPSAPFATRDSNELREEALESFDWYSLRWRDYFAWEGRGAMPARERGALRSLVERIHRSGRRLRFWDTPDSETLWSELVSADVDMLGTDDLPRLRRFLAEGNGSRRPAADGCAGCLAHAAAQPLATKASANP